MQDLELLLFSAGGLVAVALIATQVAQRGASEHPAGRLLLGIVPAVIAVVVIAILRTDVVPDDLEQPLWILAVVLVSGALVVGTTYRLARR